MQFRSIVMPLLFCSLRSPAAFGEGPVEAQKPKAKAPAAPRALGRRVRLRKPRAYFDAIRELSDVGSVRMLLRMRIVQKELKFNRMKAREVSRELNTLVRKEHDVYTKLRELRRDSAPEEFQALVDEFKAESQKSLKAILSLEQLKRLKQLGLQKSGISVFSTAAVVKRLSISAKQQEKLAALQRDSVDADWRNIKRHYLDYLGGPSGVRRAVEDFDVNRKTYTQKALKILTKSQREEYRKLVGKPVDFYPRTLRPGDPST
jgi:hypothetical protein